VQSLLSQSSVTSAANDLATTLAKDYKKSAKLFINKKFDQCLETVTRLADESIALYDQNVVDSKLFVNIWSLYFNLLDIFVNKDVVKQLSSTDLEKLTREFLDPDYFFDKLFQSHDLVPPKLILLLLLIKLNNPQTDLAKLRSKTDLYLVNASSVFNPLVNEEEYNDFKDLLEIYHVHLMAKLGEFEEAEYLIRSNPHLSQKQDELVARLIQTKTDLEEEAKQEKELQKKRQAQAALVQQKKEQRLKEQRLLKEKKRREKAAEEEEEGALALAKKESQELQQRNRSSTPELTVLDILKERILKLKLHKRSALVLLFTVVSLLAFSKKYGLISVNRRVKEQLQRVWGGVLSTLKMAFQVTYV
jgi:hypothetical protein